MFHARQLDNWIHIRRKSLSKWQGFLYTYIMSFSPYTIQTNEQVLSSLGVASLQHGLSTQEVEVRSKEGRNEFASQQLNWVHILLRQFNSSFIYLLLGASVFDLFLKEYIDALFIIAFVLIDVFLGFFQEYHSEKTIALLKKYVAPRARVRRDGKEFLIDARELVCGDSVVVQAGDGIPADIRFLETTGLMINEAALTGESVPVSKNTAKLIQETKEYFKALNIGFAGTVVVSGKGSGVVIGIGKNSALGAITQLAGGTKRKSSFEKDIQGISKFILRLVIGTLVVIVTANALIKGESFDGISLIIFSIALAVSVIPEALPVVTTFSFSRGALRLAKKQVVVKRLSAIEDLGGIEVLCTDKTGTLTENILTVQEVFSSDAKKNRQLAFFAGLAGSNINSNEQHSANAFDSAIWKYLSNKDQQEVKKYEILGECPFDPVRRRNSVLVQYKKEKKLLVRGALESLLPLCGARTKKEYEPCIQWAKEQGIKGRRVLAVCEKNMPGKVTRDLSCEEQGLTLVGLLSFVDPLKETTIPALQKAKNLGIAVKVVTGDSKEVAGAVGVDIGLCKNQNEVLGGEEFEQLNDEEQKKAVREYNIFARVSPEQKFNIVERLQGQYKTGFLGEGMNDAPALKVAHVGIVVSDAMDIAREAADIVLLEKSLGVIIDGIYEGRKTFVNTTKYIRATLSSNFGNFYAVGISSLFVNYLPMLPVQILLVNLLSDFPMIAIATDSMDDKELERPHQFNMKDIAFFATLLGIVSTVFDFIFFAYLSRISVEVLQTGWFIGSIITELLFIFSIRTRGFFWKGKMPSMSLMVLTGCAFIITIALPFMPFGHTVFKFTALSWSQMGVILGITAAYFAVSEAVKLGYYKFRVTSNLNS